MFGLFKRCSGKRAKERLKNVLLSDRAFCAPETIDHIREDIINVLLKYKELDVSSLHYKVLTSNINKQNMKPMLLISLEFHD